ncbi:MAG: hypothetical protein ACK5A1_14675 [Planctomyces sp.]
MSKQEYFRWEYAYFPAYDQAVSPDIATQQLDFEHEREKFLKIAFTWQASTLQTTSSL